MQATNTQNRIERKDFAALDPLQQRFATDVSLELGKRYAYKSGDVTPKPAEGCTIDEAAVALACSSNIPLAVQAKREAGLLFDQKQYTVIFTSGLTGRKLWRAVSVMRAVDAELASARSGLSGREGLVAVHGNRFILFMVYKQLKNWDSVDDVQFEKLITTVPSITRTIRSMLMTVIERVYPSSYAANLFKNNSKCAELDRIVSDELPAPVPTT